MIVITLIGYVLLGVYEFIPLYKEKRMKEFRVNLFLGLVSFTVAVLLSFDVRLPSPLKPIQSIYFMILGK